MPRLSAWPRCSRTCRALGCSALMAARRCWWSVAEKTFGVPSPHMPRRACRSMPCRTWWSRPTCLSTQTRPVRALLARAAREEPELDLDYAHVGFSNVMPHGYNKGSGARMLCELLGIDTSEVVVFGDAGNDLPLFSVVPNSVAVANAQPEAARAARWHIGRCEDDAVAAAIEALASGEWPFSA